MSGKNRKPRKTINQPTLPSLNLPSFYGQQFPANPVSRPSNPLADFRPQLGGQTGSASGHGGDGSKPAQKLPSWNGWTIPNTAQNGVDDDWKDILNKASSGDFANWLSSLGFGGKDPNDAWTQDFNAYLMQQMVEYYKQLEARGYNQQLLQDQRIYDSPTNQLSRIMGAGISRDAAIQMLSGAGAGAGAGIPFQAQAGGEGSLIAPSQSKVNQIQGVTSVFGAIAQTAGAIGALGSFGMSAASFATNLAATKAATAGQILSNTQLSKTLNGIETASTVIGAISSAVDAGIISKDHQFTSAQDMVQYIRDNADKFEPFNALKSTGALDGIMKDIYSLDALNHGYESWRKTRDQNIDRNHIVNMYALDEMFQDINIKEMQSEINLNSQKINESIQNVLNTTKLTNADVSLKLAQVDLTNHQSDIAYIQREMQQLDLDWISASIDDINSVRTNQLMLDAARWSALQSDKDAWDAEIKSWLSDKANLRTAIAIESYYFGARKSATDALQQKLPFSDASFAQTVCWLHNLFAQTTLPRPGSATQQERDLLGNLSGSQVALWALRKYYHMP